MKKIVVRKGVLGEKPIFEGTRIPVELILEFLANGASSETILDAYPSLSEEDIRNAIRFATDHLKETKFHPASV